MNRPNSGDESCRFGSMCDRAGQTEVCHDDGSAYHLCKGYRLFTELGKAQHALRGPTVKGRPRSRNKDGTWRRKRSDAGVPRPQSRKWRGRDWYSRLQEDLLKKIEEARPCC